MTEARAQRQMDPARGAGAVLELVQTVRELRLDRCVGGVSVAALKLVRVLLQVVQLLLAGTVLGVHVPLGPDRLKASIPADRLLDQQLASPLDTRLLHDR